MSVPAKMAHVVILTNHITDLRDWWCNLLGAHVVFEDHKSCFITYDDEHHRLAFVDPGRSLAPRPSGAVGAHHIAFTFASLAELLDTYRRLKDDGILPITSVNHGPTTSLYYTDPEGNRAELLIDCFDEPDACTAWMHSPEYENDFFGDLFDPEEMHAALSAGVPATELIRRRDDPRRAAHEDAIS